MVETAPTRLQSLRTTLTAGVGGVAALLTSWGIGLFEVRTAPPPSALLIGRPIAAGEWQVRFDRVARADRLPDGRPTVGRRALRLDVELLNRTARTSGTFTHAIRLATPIRGADAAPMVYLPRDRAPVLELQPGLPEHLVYVWTYPAGAVVPGRVRFTVEARNFKPRDNLYAAAGWFDPHTIGAIVLPVMAGHAS